jgi:uncharacterized protein (TIGR00369 family)
MSYQTPPFQRALHIQVRVGPENEGVAWVDVDSEVHYGRGSAHGGILGALVDIAGGIAVARGLPDPLTAIEGTVELKVNFLRKVTDGDITATARLVHLGRRIGVADVDVTNKGRLCAKAIATYMLNRSRES